MPSPIQKDLIAASATPLVLAILAKGDSYGYAIIREVKERSGGSLSWTEGMLYPILHRLEEQGLVETRWEGEGRRRKYYRIKAEGRSSLALLLAQWRAVDATIDVVLGGESDVRD
jgi:DNA-binding PadR family transcriptional regulator